MLFVFCIIVIIIIIIINFCQEHGLHKSCVLYPNYCMFMRVVFYICTYISASREERHLPTTWRINHKSINQSIYILSQQLLYS